MRILIVDEQVAEATRIAVALRAAGHGCKLVENAKFVFDPRLNNFRLYRPDVIVTAFRMAEMTGLELVREVRRRGLTLPVIIMSADDVERAALEAGADAFVSRFNCPEALIHVLSRWQKQAAE